MADFTDIRNLIKRRLQPTQVIDFMNTVPLYQNRPNIVRHIGPEPSIRDYYIKPTTEKSFINVNAYVKFTKKQDFSKNFKFEEKSKKELLNDLEKGNPNNVNEYIIFTPEYLKPKNRGQPILNNNSIVGASIPTGPIERPYDTLTQEEMENRDRQDEALLSRLQQSRSRLNDKLDESQENADNNENVKQQIRYNNKTRLKDIEVKDNTKLKGVTKTSLEKKEAEQKIIRI